MLYDLGGMEACLFWAGHGEALGKMENLFKFIILYSY
jgi:hypothetical protein